ncbi:MAG: hypothetical protein Q4E91_06065 [Lachnospiraceae bacterium]|nr:hypothetical protein [Lachnospiraceae bacterium]
MGRMSKKAKEKRSEKMLLRFMRFLLIWVPVIIWAIIFLLSIAVLFKGNMLPLLAILIILLPLWLWCRFWDGILVED